MVYPHFATLGFKPHVIGGEHIALAINRAQIWTPCLLLRKSLWKTQYTNEAEKQDIIIRYIIIIRN